MPVLGPGVVRMVRLFFPSDCCGTDTHTFGLVRRGNRVSVVHVGEGGETIPVGPHRRLLRQAAVRLAD